MDEFVRPALIHQLTNSPTHQLRWKPYDLVQSHLVACAGTIEREHPEVWRKLLDAGQHVAPVRPVVMIPMEDRVADVIRLEDLERLAAGEMPQRENGVVEVRRDVIAVAVDERHPV